MSLAWITYKEGFRGLFPLWTIEKLIGELSTDLSNGLDSSQFEKFLKLHGLN